MCRTTIEKRDMGEPIAGDFTLDDAAAVCLYTLELDKKKYEMSPYDLLNRALRAKKDMTKEIVKVRDVLYLVMTALKHPFLSLALFMPPCWKSHSTKHSEQSIPSTSHHFLIRKVFYFWMTVFIP